MKLKYYDYPKINRIRCILGLVVSCLIMIFVFGSVVYNLVQNPSLVKAQVGLQTFRMFTTLSNMVVAFTAVLCIPFEIDGLRNKNYHLPRWIVICLYVGVTCVTLTFIVAITALSIVEGFFTMMIKNTNLYLHTLTPICGILLFIFINSDHKIKFSTSFISLIPVLIYALLYGIMVFAIGVENGGWSDHYKFNVYSRWYIVLPVMIILVFGLSNLIRYLHNIVHNKTKMIIEQYYQNSKDYDYKKIEDAIIALAKQEKQNDKGGELIIPRRIIKIMNNIIYVI